MAVCELLLIAPVPQALVSPPSCGAQLGVQISSSGLELNLVMFAWHTDMQHWQPSQMVCTLPSRHISSAQSLWQQQNIGIAHM